MDVFRHTAVLLCLAGAISSLGWNKGYRRKKQGPFPDCIPKSLYILLSDSELSYKGAVALDILLLKVPEQIAPVSDHLQKAAAAVMIVFMDLEMLGEIVYPLCQDGDLHLRRTGVAVMALIVLYNGCFYLFYKHVFTPFEILCPQT